jgi:drug/metabolite transporter (DMT)-like permease
MAGTEKTAAIVFYFSLTASCLSLLTLPFGWVWPTGLEWALLIGAGLVGGLGQIFLTASYRYAEAGVLAPFTYVSMIWALAIGYFVFNEVPTLAMLLGAALVISAGVAIVLRERQLGMQRTAERKVRVQD